MQLAWILGRTSGRRGGANSKQAKSDTDNGMVGVADSQCQGEPTLISLASKACSMTLSANDSPPASMHVGDIHTHAYACTSLLLTECRPCPCASYVCYVISSPTSCLLPCTCDNVIDSMKYTHATLQVLSPSPSRSC